ncbi:MAG TPA: glycosyl hydrolase family 28-related protein [Anaerolineae bacterium]|nr:glycosyl hydrolase family 28-related protein [Anaerolineae bacterium]
MKTQWFNLRVLSLILILALTGTLASAQAQLPENKSSVSVQSTVGTAFTYQGQLHNASGPITANCDFRFTLWNAPSGGAQIGALQTKTSVALTEGVFTIPDLDFGSGAFNGDARWLQIAVKCPGDAAYTTMNQRQALTAAPYAQFAGTIYRRTVVVSPIGAATENGAALLNALVGITDASATNPYLIHIEPGVYDLITDTLQMKSYVDMEGSGENVTIITAAGTPVTEDFLWPKSTLSGADNAELRFLTVRNTGGNQNAVAIYNRETSPRLTHVTVSASNGFSQTLGVFNNGGSSRMSDMTIAVTGATTVQGVFIFRGASSTLTNVAITASGGSGEGININFSSPTIRNSAITSSGVGVEVNDANDTPPWNTVTIDTSQIHSGGSTLRTSYDWPGMTTVRIGASQLAGGAINNPYGKITYVCAGVYDENYVLAAGCP